MSEMKRIYRGKECRLKVKGSEGEIKKLTVNGNIIEGNFIPYSLIEKAETVEITAEFE